MRRAKFFTGTYWLSNAERESLDLPRHRHQGLMVAVAPTKADVRTLLTGLGMPEWSADEIVKGLRSRPLDDAWTLLKALRASGLATDDGRAVYVFGDGTQVTGPFGRLTGPGMVEFVGRIEWDKGAAAGYGYRVVPA